MEETILPLEIREAGDADLPFVLDSWISSYKRSRWAGVIPNDLAWDVWCTSIKRLLARGARVLVAHIPGAPDDHFGFICYEDKEDDSGVAVHYVFTKSTWRKNGVAERLVKAAAGERRVFYTFRTEGSGYFRRPKYPWTFAPEVARRKTA